MSLSLGNILSVDLTSKKFESRPADESATETIHRRKRVWRLSIGSQPSSAARSF